MAVAPARTRAAMLGIALTSAQPSGHQAWRSFSVTPAAIDNSRRTPAAPNRRQTGSTSAGLTARMAL